MFTTENEFIRRSWRQIYRLFETVFLFGKKWRFSPQFSPSLFTALRIFHANYRKLRLPFQWSISGLKRWHFDFGPILKIHNLRNYCPSAYRIFPFFDDRTKLKILSNNHYKGNVLHCLKRFTFFNEQSKISKILTTCRVLMQISDRVCVMRVLKQAGRTERIL